MKKIIKNRIFLAVLALVLAVIFAFVVSPLIERASLEETIIYIAPSAIEKGTKIDESMVQEYVFPSKYLPVGVLTDKNQIAGKYAASDFSAGSFFFQESLSETPTVQNDWYRNMSDDELAISVTLKTLANGLSAKLEPEDIVSVIDVRPEGASIPNELKYVKVLAVTNDLAKDYDAQSNEEEGLPATVTFSVCEKQAEILAELELNSNLHIALVSRGDEDRAKVLLEQQKADIEIGVVTQEETSEETE